MTQGNSTSRRAFFWKAGAAALTAPLAAGAAGAVHASEGTASSDADLRQRLERLEDVEAIRALNTTLMRHVNRGEHEAVRALFANPDRAIATIDSRIARLSHDHAASHAAGHAVGHAVGSSGEPASDSDGISIDSDGAHASATLCCIAQIATPLSADGGTLAEMARLQGTGVIRHERQVQLKAAYRKQCDGWRFTDLALPSA